MRQPEDQAVLGYPGFRWPTVVTCPNPGCHATVKVRGEFCTNCRASQHSARVAFQQARLRAKEQP